MARIKGVFTCFMFKFTVEKATAILQRVFKYLNHECQISCHICSLTASTGHLLVLISKSMQD